MLTLGIESTCDETACAVVRDQQQIVANCIASQTELHAKYGGVFPELASRRHLEVMLPLLQHTLAIANITPPALDLIAVARGPGLIGSLLMGVSMAKGLALGWHKPLIGVNHLEAHLYAPFMEGKPIALPALGVLLSGGHTQLLIIEQIGSYHLIGTTVDDAIGEAFDKVAVMLGFPYPGGATIEQLAERGNRERFCFSAPILKASPWDLSFSGLKTAVLYQIQQLRAPLSEQTRADLAAGFQQAAFVGVVQRIVAAVETFSLRAVVLGGGVVQNKRLGQMLGRALPSVPLYFPAAALCADNGAMIAGLGSFHYQVFGTTSSPLTLEPIARWPLGPRVEQITSGLPSKA